MKFTHANYGSNCYRILVFKDAPKLLFTGLTRDIGNPREYEKNSVEGDNYFENVEIDTRIPLEETAEWLTLAPLLNQHYHSSSSTKQGDSSSSNHKNKNGHCGADGVSDHANHSAQTGMNGSHFNDM